MHGYQNWREDFSQRKIDDIPKLTNNTLIYFQRTGNRKFVFSDCDPSCTCTSVSEDEFLKRLRNICSKNGLELDVFEHSELEIDAAKVSRAKVVIGPHGGAYANIIFLDPKLNPIIIETNLQQGIYDCCKKLLSDEFPPQHFYGHLASGLGIRHVTYQPHRCKLITTEVYFF